VPGQIDAAYRDESRRLYRQSAITTCLLGVPLVPAFAVLDWIVFPVQFPVFFGMRLACVATLVVLLAVLRRPVGERFALALGLVMAIEVGLMIDVMTVMTGGHASPYYAGVNLVILAFALVMPWPPLWAGATCGVLLAGYVVGALATGPITDHRIFVSNLFFLTTTMLITVVGARVSERRRRRDFENRVALTEALRHKDEFLAKMTHELRTPIHVMIGYADILLEDALAAGEQEARPLVGSIRNHGVLLHRLVSDLLDYSKVQAGKMEIHAERVPLRDVVEEVADSFRPLSERKGLRLRTAYPGGFPRITTDAQKVQQILNNLVANALKFTDHGTITIEVRRQLDAADVVVLAEPSRKIAAADGIHLLVRDTGIGIRDTDVRALAADFHQVDAHAAAKYGGTGLGLSISKRLAQLLGGWIGVATRYGEGSTFVVFLPSLDPPADFDSGRRAA